LKIIKGADLLIIATPVDTIIALKDEILKYIDKNCIITDVGSTKEEIVNRLEKALPNYIGSHPLAGSEKRGIVNSCSVIFNGSICVLTPTKKTTSAAFKNIKRLWVSLGARIIVLTPKVHDKVFSFVSHLPHIVAFSLINTVPQELLKFSSGGLKDTTRIAASDTALWKDILLSNKKNSLNALRLFEINLAKIKSAIKNNDKQALEKILFQSKKTRDILK
jgi:prephenate dehydrogenase